MYARKNYAKEKLMRGEKIMGMTPVMFSFKGRVVFCPPYIFLPTTLFAYCTGSLRSELVIKTIKAISATHITRPSTPMIVPIHHRFG